MEWGLVLRDWVPKLQPFSGSAFVFRGNDKLSAANEGGDGGPWSRGEGGGKHLQLKFTVAAV